MARKMILLHRRWFGWAVVLVLVLLTAGVGQLRQPRAVTRLPAVPAAHSTVLRIYSSLEDRMITVATVHLLPPFPPTTRLVLGLQFRVSHPAALKALMHTIDTCARPRCVPPLPLTTAEWANRFGAPLVIYEFAQRYLLSYGLHPVPSPDRTWLTVTGTPTDIQHAFHVRLYRFTTTSLPYTSPLSPLYAPSTAPVLPPPLDSWARVSGLNNLSRVFPSAILLNRLP